MAKTANSFDLLIKEIRILTQLHKVVFCRLFSSAVYFLSSGTFCRLRNFRRLCAHTPPVSAGNL